MDKVTRMLDVVENDILPLTAAGVKQGNKIFGAAILRKKDLSLVLAATNNEMENPLWHGEIHALKKLYEMPKNTIPAASDCLFFATHEPCPLCLSAITWGGFDNFYYLFSYQDSKDAFNIPHDLKILSQVFKCHNGEYARANDYWRSYDLVELIQERDTGERKHLQERIDNIRLSYDELSEIYQKNKQDNMIPLK